MNKSPRSSVFEQLQNAQCKVVCGQIGDSSSLRQLVDPFALWAGDIILLTWYHSLLVGSKGELDIIQGGRN